MKNTAILLITCPDRKGLTAAVTDFVARHGGNILSADQHVDRERDLFLMRIEWDRQGFELGEHECRERFAGVAAEFGMTWRLETSDRRPKVALFVSKYDHCLVDLLYRRQSGELACDIPLVVSNHPDCRRWAEFYHVPYHHIPVTAGTKPEAERRQMELLAGHGIDLVVMARYMQVLSGEFLSEYAMRVINVHHSFLPAFTGARPYRRAYERGVKLIGATSHYATEDLDEGPIIDQQVAAVSHRDGPDDLVEKGRDTEKAVLARAVRWHIEHRILTYDNRTVVFS